MCVIGHNVCVVCMCVYDVCVCVWVWVWVCILHVPVLDHAVQMKSS